MTPTPKRDEVEAGAKALYGFARVIPDDAPTWEEADEETREHLRGGVRTVLAAVPPAPPSIQRDVITRDRDVILEALETYRGYMLDDDYEPQGTLDKIIKRMQERVAMSADEAAPPSIPEREKVLEAISRAHYQFDRHTPCMSRGHAEAILSAIAALERK